MGFERLGIVVVVGAINVDFVVVAPQLPGPGETVVGAGMHTYGGGKGANAAVAAARAGATVHLVAAIGTDATGAEALSDLRAEGIDVAAVAVLKDQPTGVALIVVDHAGENQIAVGGGANAALTAEHVRTSLQPLLDTAGCVLISSEIPAEAVAAAVVQTVAAGVCCILNPAPVQASMIDLARLGVMLTPNETELIGLLKLVGGSDELLAGDDAGPFVTAGAARLAAISGQSVIVTRGGDGVVVVGPNGSSDHIPARPTVVRDTTGAGDTFNGVLAARLAGGDTLIDAVTSGVVAASLSVAVVGARGGMPTLAEIQNAR